MHSSKYKEEEKINRSRKYIWWSACIDYTHTIHMHTDYTFNGLTLCVCVWCRALATTATTKKEQIDGKRNQKTNCQAQQSNRSSTLFESTRHTLMIWLNFEINTNTKSSQSKSMAIVPKRTLAMRFSLTSWLFFFCFLERKAEQSSQIDRLRRVSLFFFLLILFS